MPLCTEYIQSTICPTYDCSRCRQLNNKSFYKSSDILRMYMVIGTAVFIVTVTFYELVLCEAIRSSVRVASVKVFTLDRM